MLAILAVLAAASALLPLGATLGMQVCRFGRLARLGRAPTRCVMPAGGSPYRCASAERPGRETLQALPPWMARAMERQARRRANLVVSASHTMPGA